MENMNKAMKKLQESKMIKTESIDKEKVLNTKYKDLPDMCYGLLPSDKSVIIIKKGEKGYFETDFGKIENPEEFVDQMNKRLGVTPEQRMVMEIRSMHGNWLDENIDLTKKVEEDKYDNYFRYRNKIFDSVFIAKKNLDEQDYKNYLKEIKNFINEEIKRVKESNNKTENLEREIDGETEDGWGEDIEGILEPFFSDTDELEYEIRNCIRGSYAGFGDTVNDLIQKLSDLTQQLEDAKAEIEMQETSLQEGFISDLRQKKLADRIGKTHAKMMTDKNPSEKDIEKTRKQYDKDWKKIHELGKKEQEKELAKSRKFNDKGNKLIRKANDHVNKANFAATKVDNQIRMATDKYLNNEEEN